MSDLQNTIEEHAVSLVEETVNDFDFDSIIEDAIYTYINDNPDVVRNAVRDSLSTLSMNDRQAIKDLVKLLNEE
tara:strand:- start:257 stop:478 length:222 start_codon:yes stop_codon:yes gene_type:complete